MLPQTGFQSHPRGSLIRQFVQEGHLQQAVDTMQKHRTKFNVEGLFSKQEHKISETYKECRKMLPHIDSLLTERLRSQTSVSTSLMQALFSEVKAHLKVDLDLASVHLTKLEEQADLLGTLLSDLMEEHFQERVAMFVMCGCTLIVCCVAVWGIKKSLEQQQKMRDELMKRIDSVIEQGNIRYSDQVTTRHPVRKDRPAINATTSFDFSGGLPPPSTGREVALLS